MQKTNRTSLNLKEEKIAELYRMLPEVFTENKVDFDKLRAALGDSIQMGPEKFSFSWAGKSNAIKNVLVPSRLTLNPKPEESIKWDNTENLFIEGDNLEVLKLLQKAYFEKVKMIYIDPPYNTGHDFVYNDDFSAPLDNYLKQTGQKSENGDSNTTNKETNGRYHSDWLSMMYPRLKLAWNLLREDGVIFMSIDDNESHHLRMLMDEIFGEENFIADVAVVNNLKGRNDKRYIATANERMLMYVKSDIFEESGLELPEERMGEFDQVDEIGRWRYLGLRKRGGADTEEKRPKLFFPLYVNPKTNEVSFEKKADFTFEVLPKKSDGTNGCWRWGNVTVKLRIKSLIGKPVGNEGRYDVFEKDYLETDGEIRRIKPKSVMAGTNYSTDTATKAFRLLFPEVEFQNPKSVLHIKDLVAYSTLPDEGDIVLDFFAGSGTTAHAVIKQNQEDGGNRKFICVQLPEKLGEESSAYKVGYKTISDIAKERIRRVINGYGEDPQLVDSGFKVFSLSESNYPENNFVFDAEKSQEENQKVFIDYLNKAKQNQLFDKENDTSLVYENIVKEGLSLNSTVEKTSIGKNNVYKVTGGEQQLLICLENKLASETVKELTDKSQKGKIFICLESALDDTTAANLSLNLDLKTI